MIVSEVDILYQDIAQRDQAEIALRNLFLLRNGGYLILMLKTRSISGREEPQDICRRTVDELIKAGLSQVSVTWINRFHRDHAAIVCQKN